MKTGGGGGGGVSCGCVAFIKLGHFVNFSMTPFTQSQAN